jgi:glutamyl-tRNA synthetase
MTEPVRTRFAPSPTGDLHVGNVRSALYNWAFARHNGGVFVLRIEDTDAARSTEESSRGVVEQMSWLGLDWDEGPEVGGPYAPYVQTGRLELYRDVVARLREAGYAYDSYSTDDEVKARRAARGDKTQGYDNYDRRLTDAQVSAFRAEGRTPVVRFRMPDEPVVFEDMVRGEVRFEPGNVPDYVLARADGSPLYPLTNPVDDAVMGITHVLRGEDLLPSTPRQIPLHAALRSLGIASGPMPRFGHLPIVLGEGRRRISKRNTPEASLRQVRAEGFLAEGILNYLALLGWSPGGDQELFTLDEMVAAFSVEKINRNPATFDVKKLTAINGVKIRSLEPGGRAAGAGAVRDPGRGGRPARVPARARPPLLGRSRCRGEGAHAVLGAGAGHGRVRARRPAVLDGRGRAGDAAGRAGRPARAQAAGRVRAGAGGGDRAHRVAAAVRVDRAARPRADAGAAAGRAGRFGGSSGHGLTSTPGAPGRWAR